MYSKLILFFFKEIKTPPPYLCVQAKKKGLKKTQQIYVFFLYV